MRKKQITRCVLLAVFAVVSITAVLVSRHEEKVEQIKNSGKTILSIPTDTVTAPSWTNEDGTFSFTKGDTWTYDGDSKYCFRCRTPVQWRRAFYPYLYVHIALR